MSSAEIYQFPSTPKGEVREKRGPQVEDGYTRIANELFEAVTNAQTCPVTLRQMRVVLAVIRKTYGFNKKADRISDGQLAAETGLSRQNVNKAKRELIAMHVLYLDGHKLGVNKHCEQWDFSAKPEKDNLRQTRDSVSKPETKSVSKSGSHKRQKDTLSTDVDREAPKKQRLNVSEFQDQVAIETLHAFAEHRRALRSPLTQHALGLTVKAAIKASEELGITAEQAIDEAITAGWKTVRADWLRNRGVNDTGSDPSVPACPHADLLAIWDETCGKVKGKAPNLLDWQGTKSADALAERWAEFYGVEVNGRVRYDSLETGLKWWRMALETIAAKQDFRSADADIWSLFYKGRFGRAANGNLCSQGGATR
jgi:phage replication O-like protein O